MEDLNDIRTNLALIDQKLDIMNTELKNSMEKTNNRLDKINRHLHRDITDSILSTDKRYSKSEDIFPQQDMLNRIVEQTTELLMPYVNYIDIIGIGNHELTVLRKYNYDIIRDVLYRLNQNRKKELIPIYHGGYARWVRFIFNHNSESVNTPRTSKFDIYMHHGIGGSAPVTKGMIDLSRLSGVVVDLIVISHKHRQVFNQDKIMSISDKGDHVDVRNRMKIITGCFKQNINLYDINSEGMQVDYGEQKFYNAEETGGQFLNIKIKDRQLKARILTG